jgi:preprotein translocase subunit SecB
MTYPVCHLDEFFMTRVNVAWHEPSQPGSVDIDFLFDYDVAKHTTEKNRFRLAFRLGVKSKTPMPVEYSLDCEIVGFFHFPQETTDDAMQRLIRLNGCTILYGVLRGQLANITGSFPRQKLILPTVMMEDVVNDIEREKAQARESHLIAEKKVAKKSAKRTKPATKK